MRLGHVVTSARMTALDLSRRRTVIALSLVLPPVFFAVVAATAADRVVPISIAELDGQVISVPERRQSLVFIAVAAAGLISAFFASNLIQRQIDTNRRLVLCGYRATELIVARLAVMLGLATGAALYTWLLAGLFSTSFFPAGMLLGLAIAALVYGCYGLLVGTLFRNDLETVFAILVLINVDAGWLQNPLYYQNAASKWLIESLPAHYPSQTSYVATFSSAGFSRPALIGIAYASVFLIVAIALYHRRMKMAG